jgi:predicted nucleotidyltransferase component of viral defense system
MRDKPEYQQYLIKEYIQCQILEYISNTRYVKNLSFIGGTNLRLIKHIDRLSEDLDFDCKNMAKNEFISMTEDVLRNLVNSGYTVESKEREYDSLVAYRRSIYFPQLLFSLGLSGYKNARFLIKLEMQDQGFIYPSKPAFVQSCGFYFPIPVPPDDVLCAMKISAMLSRSKGRDFYDTMFLLGQTKPSFGYLGQKHDIHDEAELQQAIALRLSEIDLTQKQKDFEHLLFNRQRSTMILDFDPFIKSLTLT